MRAGTRAAPFRFMGARASGAHISGVCSRCARLRRACGRGRPRTQDSTPWPRRGFQVLSEGFSPQSPRAGETFALPGSGEGQTGCLPFVPTAVLTKVKPDGQG